MENSHEGESSHSEVVIIGQEFQLYKADRISPELRGTSNKQVGYATEVLLTTDLPDLEKIPFRIYTQRHSAVPHTPLTPFKPELGYTITSADFNEQLRKEKVAKLDEESQNAPKNVPHPLASSVLTIHGETDAIKTNSETGKKEISAGNALRDLRLVLSFPTGISLESEPRVEGTHKNRFNFNTFYPSDYGRLAAATIEEQIKQKEKNLFLNGLFVYVPDDIEQLEQIKASFILLNKSRYR